MEEKGGRFRKKKTSFSMVSNSIIRDETISLRAKGLFALIQSYITIENFTLYKSFLVNKCCEGERAFETAWKELKENGYLKQYKMREGAKGFYYEYELLDEPETEEKSPDQEVQNVDLQNVGVQNVGVQNVGVQNVDLQNVGGTKCGCINNIINNNTIQNNNISNHIISINNVMDQIGYDAFNKANRGQLDGIVNLITEIMNTPDDKMICVSKENISSKIVKERFSILNSFHIQYVLECINNNTTKITNFRNYLITTLFNAPLTMELYYQNKYTMINKGDQK